MRFFLRFSALALMVCLLLHSCSGSPEQTVNEKPKEADTLLPLKTFDDVVFALQNMIPDSLFSDVIMGSYYFKTIRAKTPQAIWDTTGESWRNPGVYLHDMLNGLNDRAFDSKGFTTEFPYHYESFVVNYDEGKIASLLLDALPYLHTDRFNALWKKNGEAWKKKLEEIAKPYRQTRDSLRAILKEREKKKSH